MSLNEKFKVFGHCEGHTDVCYSKDGCSIYSCGNDGDVRVWNGLNDENPRQSCLGDSLLAINCKDEKLFVGSDQFSVQSVNPDTLDIIDTLSSFESSVNHIHSSFDHEWICAGSDDMSVKTIELSSRNSKVFKTSGVVLSVVMSPKADYISVSSGDGFIQIYNFETEACVEKFNVVPRTNGFENAKVLARCDFRKFNDIFAYPNDNSVVLLKVSNWTEVKTLKCEKAKGAFSVLSFSPCGNFLAGGTNAGDIIIWELHLHKVVGVKNDTGAVTAIKWNPLNNGEFIYANAQGWISLVKNSGDMDNVEPEPELDTVNDVDDVDDENVISLEKLKNDVMRKFDDDDDDATSRCSVKSSRTPALEEPLQEAFMPSSTPHWLNERIFCWNNIAIMRSTSDESELDFVEVEFHDSTLHSSMMITQPVETSLGSVSRTAVITANRTKVHVIPLSATNKDWFLDAPNETSITAVAISDYIVAFALDSYLIHVCTIHGIQLAVFSVPGPLVTMTAHNFVLMVAYHNGPRRQGDQQIEIMLVEINGYRIKNRYIKCALAPTSQLRWIGFSDMGTPASMDSSKMLYLHPLQSEVWLPICDISKLWGHVDELFPIALIESTGTLRGVRCKGTRYPRLNPRPAVQEINLQAPFLEMDIEKHKLQSNLFTMLTIQSTDKKRLYADSIKAFGAESSNTESAYELIRMLDNPTIARYAVTAATRLNKLTLAQKITELIDSENDENKVEDPQTPKLSEKKLIKPNTQLLKNTAEKMKKLDKVDRNESFSSSPSMTQDLSLNSTIELSGSKKRSNPFAQGSSNTKVEDDKVYPSTKRSKMRFEL